MKPLAYLLFLMSILFISACKKETANQSNKSLTGKWKLYSFFSSNGGPGIWTITDARNTNYIQFDADGKLLSNYLTEFSSYTIKDTITLAFSRNNNTIENYYYKINKDTLVINPSGPTFCIEGCSTKFTKQK